MSSLCGWIGETGNTTEPSAILASMVSKSRNSFPDSNNCLCSLNSALWLTPGTGTLHNSFNHSNNLCVAIEGRPYFTDTKLALQAQSQGYAAAIADLYHRHGNDFLRYLSGAFALVILNTRSNTLFAAVDRLGIRPLCYATYRGQPGIAFASNTDSLKAHPQITSSLNPQALYDYLFFHMVPCPETIYENIFKLQPAQYLEFSGGRLNTAFYWKPQFKNDSSESIDTLAAELRKRLTTAVQRSHTPLKTGCFLSGGIDSSTIAGLASEVRQATVDTFSIGFDAPGYDEMEFARISSRHFATRQHEYYVSTTDVTESAPKIAAIYDEPFGNASAVPVYHCARLAKENGMEVLLAGDGGDELFAGNARYAQQKVFEFYNRVPKALRTGILEPIIIGLPGSDRMPVMRKARSYIEQANIPLPIRIESYNYMLRTAADTVFNQNVLRSIDTQRPFTRMREIYERADTESIVDRMLYLDWTLTLADNDLRKVNRMCELAGIQVIYPFLDDSVVEFSTQVPASLKLKGLKLRYFFKHAMRNFLPPTTISKSKQGFGLPFGVWLKDSGTLQELAYASLEQLKRRDLFRHDFIDGLIKDHRSGHGAYYGTVIWVLMMLELWMQSHL